MFELFATTGLGTSLMLWLGFIGIIWATIKADRERRDP